MEYVVNFKVGLESTVKHMRDNGSEYLEIELEDC